PLVITFVVGVVMALEFFVPHYRFKWLTDELTEWGLILAAAAYVLGILNLLQVNVPKIVRRERDWPYKLLMVVAMVVTLGAGLGQGKDGPVYEWVYKYIFEPLSATMFSLLAFFIASAAFRAFRARNLDAAVLLSAAVLVMLASVPIGEGIPVIGEYLPGIRNWIMDVPNTAARRAIFIGAALGAVATGLRVILGIERSHLGGDA
ncbi:MAG: hypothetical protein AAF211_24665, partial [Myxococcota bacterium]